MKVNNKRKLSLVGAGPGNPKLISIAGVEALMSANVVLYDALVSKELLKYAPTAEKIFVGKRKSKHYKTQDEIHQLIVEKANTKGHVVRLKGGDPFVFGRGAEELEVAKLFGIPHEIIPGISSATSVPSAAGISLTKRGVAQSFWVLTGTTSQGKLSKDIQLAAQSSATLVILMGISKLDQIVGEFKLLRKSDMPVAIIQEGYTEHEKFTAGHIYDISEIVREKGVSNPAIIVIGEVVRNSQKLKDIYHQYTLQN
jgi:uroporphyrin-III C-methyltransferase